VLLDLPSGLRQGAACESVGGLSSLIQRSSVVRGSTLDQGLCGLEGTLSSWEISVSAAAATANPSYEHYH
jgi:hypothetical protein